MPEKKPHHIIAIGASAGGLEEINTFFDHTPLDGVSYVIVQHLSPDFKSRMVELLAKHSKLEVKEATMGMHVLSNKVYLIPNDKFMTIHDYQFTLTNKGDSKGPHLTINKFFNSLALDCGKNSIGIILSGLGSDGTEGIKAIKKAGGLVIARDPETSEFDSMPANAIATGMVDFILEPKSMPITIEEYVNHEEDILPDNSEDEINLKIIIAILKVQSPHDFTDYKTSTILRRIKRRAEYNNCNTLKDYIDFLRSTPKEIEDLVQEFLISVTSFFRDQEAYATIQTKILPQILKKLAPGEELKLWVAGCATGEEAYSMAILISELLTGNYKDTIVKIFATDIDTIALMHAGKGIYDKSIEKDITQLRLEKYFVMEGSNYRVKPELRKMVIFAKHDLVKNPPYCNMHLISCRNLLIYMTPVLQKKIFLMLLFGLRMNGYLFLGSSESPMPIIENLEEVNRKWRIYKNLETKRIIRFDAFSLPEIVSTASGLAKEEMSQGMSKTLAEAMNESFIDEGNYLAICIDENNQVIKTYGDTTKFLLQKNFNINLLELLPRTLAVAFNNLSIKALKSNKKERASGIKIKHDESVLSISMSVSPLGIKKGDKQLLSVFFSEDPVLGISTSEEFVFDENKYHDQYTLNIERELKEVKDKLHIAYTELATTNENMQSFNEELLSANEEMQSTNEEMQSVNEELHTINSEFQLKNKELLELNDDLNNYFRSNINGQLFVNNELQLIKFSPGTVKQINLLASDVGRPLSNISTNIKFETIIDDIKHVIAQGDVITKEIQTENGKWYQVMTMPYILQLDNKINGAIVTFNDITELKKSQQELDRKNNSLTRINDDLDNFVHTASHDLLAPLANIELSIEIMNEINITDPKQKQFLNIINNSIKKFRSLVSEISSTAKIENDVSSMEMVDIDDILNDVEWSLEHKIKSTGVIINRDLQVKQIYFSKKNLRSILFNLISNGIKFKRELPTVINVFSGKQGDKIILSVEDNGLGIGKEDQNKIFNRYERLHPEMEGQGIGLHLASKIIKSVGGTIIVDSEQGRGSKFIVTLIPKSGEMLS